MHLSNSSEPSRRESFERRRELILGVPIDSLTWDEALERIHAWSNRGESRIVCICNVHSVVTATQDETFGKIVAQADMATPDGAPIAWMLRRLGHPAQERINGPDLMWRYCELAAHTGRSIFLYGGSPATVSRLLARLRDAFPALRIAGAESPPYRILSDVEDGEVVNRINQARAGVVLVSLGCPKQEVWMASHVGRIDAVMIGVGAAFDYHAGTVDRAPPWMQRAGFEWLHRLSSEPRRLWRRYLITNTLFVARAFCQLLQCRRAGPPPKL